MSAEPARHLRVVDENGEVHESCPGCEYRDDVIKGLQRDIRGWSARYAELRRDVERDARESDLWPLAEDLFDLWRTLTGRRRCRFSVDRFFLVEPFLLQDGYERCAQAIMGRCDDHFTRTRKNGSTVHFHEWERIFGGQANATKSHRGSFEESANRCPSDWREKLSAWQH